MRLAYDVVIALLASYGIIALVWLACGLLGRRKVRRNVVYAVVKADGQDGASLRQTLGSVRWMQQWGLVHVQPVIVGGNDVAVIARQYGCEVWDGLPAVDI